MKTEEITAQAVLLAEVQREVSEKFGRAYNASAALGNPEPGSRHVFDLRSYSASIPEILEIARWKETGEDQPNLMVMLNNLVISGRLPSALYMVVVPW